MPANPKSPMRFISSARSDSPAASPARSSPLARAADRDDCSARRHGAESHPRRGFARIDPATRTFQALRIWVNRELDHLDAFVRTAARRLRDRRPTGRHHVSFARRSDRQAHAPRTCSRGQCGDTRADEEARHRAPDELSEIRGRAARSCAPRRVGNAMSASTEAFEYAIKKDVRNNPIVREVDEHRLREQWRSVAIGVLFVGVLLFSGWQRVELLQHGYRARTDAARACRSGGHQPAPSPRDRNAEVAAAHRAAGDRASCSW